MSSDLTIRDMAPADLDAVAGIAEDAGLFPAAMLGAMAAGYLDRSKADIWLTAFAGSQVIGFAFCEPERMTAGTWNLLAIGVGPDRQGQGAGTALVRHLEARLGRDGHRVLLVETAGTPAFARARAFHLGNGFTEEARIREFYDAGTDKLVFWKRLRAGAGQGADGSPT